MLAAAAAVSSNSVNRELPAGAELLGHQPVHGGRRHRRRGVLQLGQRLAVGRRVLVRDRGLVDAQRLAELHRAALERAEHLEELLGGAALQFGGDLVAVPADQPLPEAEGGPPGGGQGQACQARRSAQGAPRDVCHLTIVTKAVAGRRRARRRARRAARACRTRVRCHGPRTPSPVAAAAAVRDGPARCGGAAPRSPARHSRVPLTVLGHRDAVDVLEHLADGQAGGGRGEEAPEPRDVLAGQLPGHRRPARVGVGPVPVRAGQAARPAGQHQRPDDGSRRLRRSPPDAGSAAGVGRGQAQIGDRRRRPAPRSSGAGGRPADGPARSGSVSRRVGAELAARRPDRDRIARRRRCRGECHGSGRAGLVMECPTPGRGEQRGDGAASAPSRRGRRPGRRPGPAGCGSAAACPCR